jgi:putative ATP-dependent endonuclease of OLD family
MPIYSIESEIAVTEVRVSNFRSLANIEVSLSDLTVLIGANNAGKTSFLDALFAAIGAGRKILGQDDVHLAPGEAFAPKNREVIIDVRIRPIGPDGKIAEKFPEGSFWTYLWGTGIAPDDVDFTESMSARITLAWNIAKGDYVVERKFLKEWRPFDDWLATPTQEKAVTAAQLEPVALHYIDAKRDLEDDLRRQGSFWRRMTEDLGLSKAEVDELEAELSGINQQIVDKSEILKHLKTNLEDLQLVVSADNAGIEIAPIARRLRDLSKGVDVSLSTVGAQSFPLARHGMGTRSLASLLVFKAFASWRNINSQKGGDKVHSILALEEPESHLHPQAQRALFSHIKDISGQRVVSTHSPYFAGQSDLDDLRLFIKKGGDTVVTQLNIPELNPDDVRKLQDSVVESRGDILFARAVVLFEGQTEEQALPIWAQKYWGKSIHELGFSFARANGTDYFPFIWLAKSLDIPWYVLADGEEKPVATLEKALERAKQPKVVNSANVIVIPEGRNFETQLLHEGYLPEVEAALNEVNGNECYLDYFIKTRHGTDYPKKKGKRDYLSEGGRMRAAADAMKDEKTSLARPLARRVSSLPDPARQFPSTICSLFKSISKDQGLKKASLKTT